MTGGDDDRWAVPVRLAGPPELTSECALPALAELVAAGLKLQVTLGRPAEHLLDGLAGGEFDVVISTIPPPGGDLRVTPLPEEEFVLVAAPSWSQRWDPRDLSGVPLIAVSSQMPVIRRYWRAVFATEPPGPPPATVHDLRSVMKLVVAGAGITVLPRYLCGRALESGELVDVVRPAGPPVNSLFLATRPETPSDSVHAVIERLSQPAVWSPS